MLLRVTVRCLIVDDNADFVDAARTLLEPQDIRIVERSRSIAMRTNSGRTALESAWAATESMATQFDIASDGAIREIDAYVLGLHVHMRFSRFRRG